MDKLLCPRCNRHVEPIKIFDRSPKTGKAYLITQCPYDRCKWNFDLEEYIGATRDQKREGGMGGFFRKDILGG